MHFREHSYAFRAKIELSLRRRVQITPPPLNCVPDDVRGGAGSFAFASFPNNAVAEFFVRLEATNAVKFFVGV